MCVFGNHCRLYGCYCHCYWCVRRICVCVRENTRAVRYNRMRWPSIVRNIFFCVRKHFWRGERETFQPILYHCSAAESTRIHIRRPCEVGTGTRVLCGAWACSTHFAFYIKHNSTLRTSHHLFWLMPSTLTEMRAAMRRDCTRKIFKWHGMGRSVDSTTRFPTESTVGDEI